MATILPGFPDATTTGVPAGTPLTTYNGDLVITTPGAVISNLNITGTVYVNAPNVTIENCRIDAKGGYFCIDGSTSTNSSGLTVQNCTLLNSAGGNVNGSNIECNGAKILNNDMSGFSHCIASDGGNLIQGNYMHDLNGTPDGHYECIYIGGGAAGDTINHNTMISFDTADVFMKTDYGPVTNEVVENNLMLQQNPVPVSGLHTASYTVYLLNTGDGVSGNVVTNNIMQQGYYGYTDVNDPGVVWQGNTDLTTGQTISVNGTLSAAPGPAAPVITSFSPDTGVVGDGITHANQITLTGTAAANSTVTVYDGSTQLGTATVSSTGSWDYITAVLTDAKHVLTAIDTNSSGQKSVASAALNVTVDTHVPVAPVLTGDSVVGTNQVNLSGTAEANSTVTVYDGTTAVGTGTVASNGTFSVTTSALSAGAHALTATATDAAGNTSAASQPLDPVIAAPTPPPPPPPPAAPQITSFSSDTGVVGDHITNDNTLTFSGTALANSTINLFDGTTTPVGTAAVDASGHWTATTKALADGTHNLTATDTSSTGTSSASAAFAVTIDTHVPAAPTMAIYAQDGSAVGAATTVSDLVLKGTAELHSTVDIFDGGHQIGIATTNSSGAWSFDTGQIANGSHSFTAAAVDVAGTTGTVSAPDIVSVSTASTPSTPSSPPPTSSHAPIEFADVSYSHGVATIKGYGDAYSQIKLYDGTKSLGTVTTSSDGSWSLTASHLSNTLHTITASELDSAGHVVEASSGAVVLAASNTSVLHGTGGDDFLFSSSSNMSDTFMFGSSFGHSTVQGFSVSGPGQDTIQFSKTVFDSFASVLSHAAQVGNDVVISAGSNTLTVLNTKLSALHNSDFHFA